MTQRTEYKFLGVTLGTFTGWDEIGPEGIQLYDFEPAQGVQLPSASCLYIMYETGEVKSIDDQGNVADTTDMLTCLKEF